MSCLAINQQQIRFYRETMNKRDGTRWWRFFFTCIFLLLASGYGYAQLGIGGGFECSPAVFISNGVFVRRPSLGISGMLSYAPRDSRLFPSFTYLLKSIAVPVNNDYYPGLYDFARNQNFVLNLNYRTTDEQNYYLLFMGIGVANVSPGAHLNDEQGRPVTLVDKGSSNLYPVMQVGGKYMYRILNNGSFYLGLEANLRYIRMHSGNVYYLQQGKNSVQATIAGDILFLGVQIHLDYFFDRNEQ